MGDLLELHPGEVAMVFKISRATAERIAQAARFRDMDIGAFIQDAVEEQLTEVDAAMVEMQACYSGCCGGQPCTEKLPFTNLETVAEAAEVERHRHWVCALDELPFTDTEGLDDEV